MENSNPFVSANWLASQLTKNSPLRVFYTRLSDIKTGALEAQAEFVIPSATLFDFENDFVDHSSNYPHTTPCSTIFKDKLRKMGVRNTDSIVVYDSHGMYAAARAWWMLKSIGHQDVYILEGGFPAWKALGFSSNGSLVKNFSPTEYTSSVQGGYFVDCSFVHDCLGKDDVVIIDARSKGRFKGTEPEPRPGLRSGHIPGSKNLPFSSIVKNGCVDNIDALKTKFAELGAKPSNHLIMTCGSGVTACILALAATICGYSKVSVYDGSWSEWGSLHHLPIEQGKAR